MEIEASNYNFLYNPQDSNSVDMIHTLLRDTYWAAERTRNEVEESLKKSLTIVVLHANEGIVGCARAITDKITFSWICDVVVAHSHRGIGLGKMLVGKLIKHPDVIHTRKILVTKDAQGLYRKFGFGTHKYECMIKYPDTDEPQPTL